MTDTESDRTVVEQAKGAIMLRYGVSSYESLAAMARWAREADVTLPDVAHALIKGICQGRVTPETRGMVRWLEQRLRADIGDVSTVPAPVTPRRQDTGARQAVPETPRSSGAVAVAARYWRYPSAVHAARALTST